METDKNKEDFWKRFEEHISKQGLEVKIARDGILNEDKFDKDQRVLFILKETNGYSKPLQELLKDGPRHQMWFTLSRWAFGILNPDRPFHTLSKAEIKEAIQRVAVINIKKIPGKAVAKPSELLDAVERDNNFLLEQIENLNPRIIITCGTFFAVKNIIPIPTTTDEEQKVFSIKSNKLSCDIIAWKHPGRKNNRNTYIALQELKRKTKHKETL